MSDIQGSLPVWPLRTSKLAIHRSTSLLSTLWPLSHPLASVARRCHRFERKLSSTFGEIRGRDDEFVSTPSWPVWSVVHLTGSGDEFTVTGTVDYPNGETWHAVMLITVRGGKVWRETDYFGPPFEPAAWREPFVERE